MRKKNSDTNRVDKTPKSPWGIVYEETLEDPRLSLDARCVAAWLETRPPDWVVKIEPLKRRLGIGPDRWARISRELRAAGYLTYRKTRDEKGCFVTRVIYRGPAADDDCPFGPADTTA